MIVSKIRAVVWNEYGDEQKNSPVVDIYPDGLHKTIADFLNKDTEIEARTAVLSEEEHGLTEKLLDETDVLLWWGHTLHDKVEDKIVRRVIEHVQRGMGIVFLHSAHKSKPFMEILGVSGSLCWREAEERCRVWTASPWHQIAKGIPENFVIDKEEMYGEPFGIPEPNETVFISWFEGGNVFRSGVTFQREYGKIFYFQPGHETYPVYHYEIVLKIISNAIKWAKPVVRMASLVCPNMPPLEKIHKH